MSTHRDIKPSDTCTEHTHTHTHSPSESLTVWLSLLSDFSLLSVSFCFVRRVLCSVLLRDFETVISCPLMTILHQTTKMAGAHCSS